MRSPGPGPQRHSGPAVLRCPYGQHLVDADAVVLEGEGAGGHVQPPHPGPPRPGEPHRAWPLGLQVGHPPAQGETVVLAEGLHVAHLEPGALELGDGRAEGRELAVGEDVGVDELVDVVRRLVALRPARDLVVEQPSARPQQPAQGLGVLQVPVRAHVFGHPDGGDGVVGPVGDVPVVLHPDLDPVGQPLVGDALAGVGGLFVGERDADDVHAVLACRVDGHGAPAASDVEEPLSPRQTELAADEFELVVLGLLQGGVRGGPVGARVDHRRAEDDLVEVVADVVVVADGALVGALGVQVVGSADLLAGRRGWPRQPGDPHQAACGGPYLGVPQHLHQAAGVLPALPDQLRHEVEGGVQVPLDVQVAGDPGPREPQLPRFPQQAAHGAAVAHDQGGRVRRPRLRTVPGADAHRQRRSQQLLDEALQPRRGVGHGAHLRDRRSRNAQHHVNKTRAIVQSPGAVTNMQKGAGTTYLGRPRRVRARRPERRRTSRTTDGGRSFGSCGDRDSGQEALASVFSCFAAAGTGLAAS